MFEQRRVQALEGLRVPAKPGTGDRWAPFSHPSYKYANLIGDLGSEGWTKTRETDPECLVMGNPYSLADGLRIMWLGAVGIPSCKWRSLIQQGQRSTPVRHVNYGFGKHTGPAFEKAGPVQGGWRRPRSPYILDLVSHNQGWEIYEMCHVLAHVQLLMVPEIGIPVAELVKLWLAKAAVCLRFNLPLFEDDWEDAFTFKSTRMTVVTGTNPQSPVFALPAGGTGCLKPFSSMGAIFVAVGCESVPSGFKNGTGRWTAATRWCCGPTQAVIAGWEFADVITHMPVVVDKGAYRIYWQELQDAATFQDVIDAGGSNGWLKGFGVGDLLRSDLYKGWYAATPALPAPNCLTFRQDQATGLIRPMSKRPEGELNPRIREHAAWINWDSVTEKIREMVEQGTVFYEGMRRVNSGFTETAAILRKSRTAAYKKLASAIKKRRKLLQKLPDLERGGWMKEARDAKDKIDELRRYCEERLGKKEEAYTCPQA